MSGRGSTRLAARLLCAAATIAFVSDPAAAQSAPPAPPDAAELDPNAPLEPLPDLGVDWPALNAKVATAPPSSASIAPTPSDETAGDMRYVWGVEGLGALGNAAALMTAFRKQSALEADRKDPANAA